MAVSERIEDTESDKIWYFDGKWTYYLQYDGTPMKDRLTYHPDGEHIIYLDANGAMEQQGLFRFANGRNLGYANADGTLMHSRFSYDPYGRIVFSLEWNDSKGIDFGW